MTASTRWTRALVGVSLALAAVLVMSIVPGSATASPCTDHAVEAEKVHGIPAGLLLSVALVESGMGGKPQPYVLNVDGQVIASNSLDEASRHLRDKAGRLRPNTMVGCMQLSLGYHKDKFRPLERILDPKANVFYAATYLKRLHAQTGSWTKALERYQGGTRGQRLAYLCKVHRNLSSLHPENAALIGSAHCDPAGQPSIAPETRRTFKNRQLHTVEQTS